MQGKNNPLNGQFLVNGTKCDVSVDEDGFSWTPIRSSRATGKKKYKFKKTKRIEFAQVIAIKGLVSPETTTTKSDKQSFPRSKAKSPGNKIKIYHSKRNNSKSSGQLLVLAKVTIACLPIGGGKRRQPQVHEHSRPAISISDEKESNNSYYNINKFSHPTSEPPSCYVSEGSTSHLSCVSSTGSSSDVRANRLSLTTPPTSGPTLLTPVGNGEKLDQEPTKTLAASEARDSASSLLVELNQRIEHSLELKRRQRPSRLLVFVNPFGGKGRAVHLYKTQVSRLIELAGIEVKLIVTNYANHARDTIEDPLFNIEYFDGIICVGGDGMFSELMNGLLFRYNREKILTTECLRLGNVSNKEQEEEIETDRTTTTTTTTTTTKTEDAGELVEEENVDGNATPTNRTDNKTNSDETKNRRNDKVNRVHPDGLSLLELRTKLGGIGKQFLTPPIPVGVIGAGSTDANSFGLIGTNDAITATLNIILGNEIKIDICSIHSIREDRPLRFVSTFVAYGYFGDVIRESEKFRWLGPSRYDLTGLNNLLKNRAYQGRVRILVSNEDGSPLDPERCHANCELCKRHPSNGNFKFLERSGAFVGVNAAVTACRCPQTKKGFSPGNHLGNGCADVILVKPCSRIQYMNYLLRTGWTKRSPFDLNYVEAFRCRQFEFFAQEGPEGMRAITKTTATPTSTASSSSSSSTSSSDTAERASSNSNSLDSNRLSSESIGGGSSWNVDGEIMEEQSIRVKVNNQLLRVFGTGEPT